MNVYKDRDMLFYQGGQIGSLYSVQAWDLPDDLSNTGVGVAFSIDDGSNSSSDSNSYNSSYNNGCCLPGWPGLNDCDGALLGSVGEVVVTGGHEVVGAYILHLDEPSSESGGGGSIENQAVAGILLHCCLVVVVGSKKLLVGQAVLLVNVGHTEADSGVLEEDVGAAILNLSISQGVDDLHVLDLDDVATVGGGLSLTSVSSWVGVTTSPLNGD